MLRTLLASLMILSLFTLTARAERSDEAVKLVERGLKAIGGRKAAAAKPAVTFEEKGTYYGMGDGVEYQGKHATQGNDQMRVEIVGVFTMVVNKDKGWAASPDGVQKMDADQLAMQKEGLFSSWVASLLPLNDKSFDLKTIGRLELDGRPAMGVSVTKKGHPEVKLYFDQKSGLLVKTESTGKAQEFGDKEILKEAFYLNYKDVGGVKHPTKLKIVYDGKKFVETELLNFELHEKLDDSVFAEPK